MVDIHYDFANNILFYNGTRIIERFYDIDAR